MAAGDEYVAHIAERMDLNELEKSVWRTEKKHTIRQKRR